MTIKPWHLPRNILSAYQEACNRFDVGVAVTYFAADGMIEYAGETYMGIMALRNAHLWDRGAQNHIAFIDLAIVDDIVYCTFVNQHELHRVLGIEGIRRPAEIAIHDGQITKLRLLSPEAKSMQAFHEKAASFFVWVQAHQSESWQRTAGLDEVGGRTLYELAHAWQAANLEKRP